MRSRPPVLTAALAAFLTAGAAFLPVAPAVASTASPDASTVPGEQRVTANTPRNVSLTPIDAYRYRVTGTPRCGNLESTCQVHVGNVGGNYHWDGGTSEATFAGWKYGETRTPAFWTYGCLLAWCKNSATVYGAPVTRPYPNQALTARLDSQDDDARTARVSGTATANAVITLDGKQVATASADGSSTGKWSADVSGLSVGENTLIFEQFVGGTRKDQASVTVTIAAGFSAAATFDADVTKPAVVGGRGAVGATVVVTEGGAEVGRTTVDAAGAWSITLAAPGRGGSRTLVAAQSGSGVPGASEEVVVDYGAAVRITSPGDGFVPSPAFPSVRVVGQAQPGVVVHLSVRDGRELGSATADENGRWAVSTGALGATERSLDASGTSKGANTTTDDLVLGGS